MKHYWRIKRVVVYAGADEVGLFGTGADSQSPCTAALVLYWDCVRPRL
jgi:hypothetical protein